MPIARCALCLLLFGCSSIDPHENFTQVKQSQVGKSADDPGTDVARLFSNRIGETTLPSGNREVAFTGGWDCRYFYEVEKQTRKIVGFRHEGDCAVRP